MATRGARGWQMSTLSVCPVPGGLATVQSLWKLRLASWIATVTGVRLCTLGGPGISGVLQLSGTS